MTEYVFYNGKRIPEELFRAFVYGVENGQVISRLAHDFAVFRQLLLSGNWFETKQEAESLLDNKQINKEGEKTKPKRKAASKKKE